MQHDTVMYTYKDQVGPGNSVTHGRHAVCMTQNEHASSPQATHLTNSTLLVVHIAEVYESMRKAWAQARSLMPDTMCCKLGKIETTRRYISSYSGLHAHFTLLCLIVQETLFHPDTRLNIEHLVTHASMPQILTTSNPASYHISFQPSPSRIDLHHKQSTDP